ncbi:MAG: type II toxin-antitoxin system HicB family antitoxin [Candidatus Uhrbacteria bacterium]|nr:type II toxin-antitoxin system HicB family antitoxin [Candidatus Uhrbacteria bacterium]
MEKKILNYLVVLEPDTRSGTGESCYAVYCPLLGLSDSGDTIEDALQNMQALIEFHLISLQKENEFFPVEESGKSMVATVQVALPA